MSTAARRTPGQTYLITRRCSERRFFLKPVALVVQILAYCLALAAQRTGVAIHAVIVLSNHFHLVVTDPDQELARFMHLVDTLVARSVNRKWKRRESLWAPGSYNAVELHGEEAVWEALTYTITNPVKDGLVARLEDWPGLRTLPGQLPGRRIHARRPAEFFRDNGGLPDEAECRATKPPALAHLNDEAYRQELERRVSERLREIRADRREKGLKTVLGKKKILQQDPFARAESPEEAGKTTPAISCRDGRYKALIEELKAWRQRYYEALEAWRRGQREAVFPAGTYRMVRFFFAACESLPAG